MSGEPCNVDWQQSPFALLAETVRHLRLDSETGQLLQANEHLLPNLRVIKANQDTEFVHRFLIAESSRKGARDLDREV